MAERILALRAADGSSVVVPYTPGSAPGAWIPTPPAFAPPVGPGWGAVTPFFLDRGDQFRLGPPPALTSAKYTEAFEEAKLLGSAVATRTQEQIDIPKFWAVSGTQGWNLIARELVAAKGIHLAKSARILALLNMAGADAVIACWDTKYEYNFWRPVTAIRAADTDGNPATVRRCDVVVLRRHAAVPRLRLGPRHLCRYSHACPQEILRRQSESHPDQPGPPRRDAQV